MRSWGASEGNRVGAGQESEGGLVDYADSEASWYAQFAYMSQKSSAICIDGPLLERLNDQGPFAVQALVDSLSGSLGRLGVAQLPVVRDFTTYSLRKTLLTFNYR